MATGVWGLKLIWSTSASLLFGLIAVTATQGLVPAALALTARGLINAAVEVVDQGLRGIGPLLPWLILGFVLTAVEAVSLLAKRYLTQRLTDDLNIRITTDILEHASTLDVAFFEDPRRRDLITRTQQNSAVRLASFVSQGLEAITNLLRAISLLAVLVMIEPLVLLVVPPFAIPFLVFQWRLAKQRYADEYYRTTKRRWTGYFVSKLTGTYSVAEVKLLDLAPLLVKKFRSLMTEFRNRDHMRHRRNFTGSSFAAVLTVGALYVLFIRVAFRTADGTLTLGDLAIFGGAAARLRTALDMAIRSLTMALEQTLFISNLCEFLRVKPRLSTKPGIPAPLTRGEIEVRNVTFAYPGSGRPVLRNVSLHIRPGETLAIVGENGAGKTTLVKLLARLYDPDGGQILFDGVDLRDVSLHQLHSRIAFVLQSFGRYEGTVAENIAYGDWRSMLGDQERIERVARATSIHSMIESMEDRYETVLGRLFGEHDLSGGQWQKIAVARAFARDASLLVLDEPTSNLDARAEYELFLKSKELSKGRTTILISHRFTTISMADRIVVMADGRIVESGTHEELIAEAGPYAVLYALHERLLPGSSPLRSGAV